MRQFQEVQLSLTPIWGSHQHTRELQMAARILDQHPEIGERVQQDLLQERRGDRGRRGLRGDQVVRIALLKQIHGLSYRELEFHLQDSAAFRSFVGLGFEDRPSHQALQANVKRIAPETWEAIHGVLIGFAQREGIERGGTIRGDTTVVDAAIHEPSDSSLLWDCVRVATRLLHRMARRQPGSQWLGDGREREQDERSLHRAPLPRAQAATQSSRFARDHLERRPAAQCRSRSRLLSSILIRLPPRSNVPRPPPWD
jgi:IS5 family transposase